ncbi:MAG: hypothetical protein L6R38_008404 [Xanthoria sp. 2 TBL-2021]|nr:MAG: hypothetical protein L6R38_008404 [Xanthoria sp. 2 TBL-2021]
MSNITLCCNDFSDQYEPVDGNRIEYQATLEHFRTLAKSMAEPTDDFLESCYAFLNAFYNDGLNRSIIMTEGGYVGLAPKIAHQGDCIVVFLGCQSPIILRPKGDEDYLAVGEVYVDGLMTAEAFLGPLPGNWQHVIHYEETTEAGWDAFVDRVRNVWQVEDPRLGPLPEGWVEETHPIQHVYACYRDIKEDHANGYNPRMMLHSLRAKNVELQEFKLV